MLRSLSFVAALLLSIPALAQTPTPAAPETPPAAAPAPVPVAPASRFPAFATERTLLGTTVSGIPVHDVDLIPGPAVSRRVRGAPDAMIEILDRGFGELMAAVGRAGLTPANAPIAVFVEIDDRSFSAELMVPLAAAVSGPSPGLTPTTTPSGRALRVLHVGSYESLEETYAEIETFIEDKGLDIRELFVERYLNEPRTTAPMDLRTEVYVMLR